MKSQLSCIQQVAGRECTPADAPPGVFIERCGPAGRPAPLTADECRLLASIRASCAWTRTGNEAGREYGAWSIRCDISESWDGLDLRRWQLGADAPARGARAWAVEFPIAGQYVRRLFWTDGCMPDVGILSAGIERLRSTIAELEADRDAAQRAGIATHRMDRIIEGKRRSLAQLEQLQAEAGGR